MSAFTLTFSCFSQIPPALTHICQIVATFLYLVDFCTTSVQVDCLQLVVVNVVLDCHHLSDLTVGYIPDASGLNYSKSHYMITKCLHCHWCTFKFDLRCYGQ